MVIFHGYVKLPEGRNATQWAHVAVWHSLAAGYSLDVSEDPNLQAVVGENQLFQAVRPRNSTSIMTLCTKHHKTNLLSSKNGHKLTIQCTCNTYYIYNYIYILQKCVCVIYKNFGLLSGSFHVLSCWCHIDMSIDSSCSFHVTWVIKCPHWTSPNH